MGKEFESGKLNTESTNVFKDFIGEITNQFDKDKKIRRVEVILQIVLGLYLFLMFAVYPLYLGDGYYHITTHKLNLYKWIHIIFFVMTGISLLFLFCEKVKKNGFKQQLKNIAKERSILDKMIVVFLVIMVLSTVFSIRIETAVCGFVEWHMGLRMFLSMCLVCLILSHFFVFHEVYLHLISDVVTIISFIGYMQRFGVNFISDKGFATDSASLSTIGNINWTCGFLAICLPIVLYLFLKLKKEQKIIYGCFLWIDLGFVVIQGSESGWLIIGMLVLMCFVLSQTLEEFHYKDLWIFLGIFTSVVTYTMYEYQKKIAWSKVRYSGINWIVSLKVWCILFVISLVGLLGSILLEKKKIEFVELRRKIVKAILIVFCIGCMILGFIIIAHAINPKLFPSMSGNHYLDLNEEWGHDRGGLARIAIDCFQQGTLKDKLIGIGPDCFYFRLMEIAPTSEQWVKDLIVRSPMIPNSHNEVLTMVVNLGLLGTIVYYGYFIMLVKKSWSHRKKDTFLYCVIFIAITCFVHNLVSFQHILATPFLFIIAGLTERCINYYVEK